MAKFNRMRATAPNARGSLPTAVEPGAFKVGFEGHVSPVLDTKTDLFNMATGSFMSEPSFYQGADARLGHFVALIHEVTIEDPEWVRLFVPWLRSTANMRTASLVAAAEYVAAGGANGRSVVAASLGRADEPGELVAYWHAFHGRALPQALRKGLADAVRRLYWEGAVLRYDTPAASVRFGDVIELSHAKPQDFVQQQLFGECLARRHNRDERRIEYLPIIKNAYEFDAIPQGERAEWMNEVNAPAKLSQAGISWERLGGWLPDGWNAQAWEAIIPSMGYMALLRNLNNLEKAGISPYMQNVVINRLTDPFQVAQSKQFPFRFYSAFKASIGTTYAHALDVALDMSTQNVPEMDGPSLVLVDVSLSMRHPVGGPRSKAMAHEVAAVMGAAWYKRNPKTADLVAFASGNKRVSMPGYSTLKVTQEIEVLSHTLDAGTEFWKALRENYKPGIHKRIIILTDAQIFSANRSSTHYRWQTDQFEYPAKEMRDIACPVYCWNLQGYDTTIFEGAGRYSLSGFTDNSFKLIPVVEAQSHMTWAELFTS